MKQYCLTLALVALASSTSYAQTAIVVPAAPAPMIVGAAPAANMLKTGTDVQLKTMTELTTQGKHLHPGDRFDMEVSEPVRMNGVVVIPAGARAVGEITAVRNKGMWGKSGNIDARALYVVMSDRQIRLTGSIYDKGKAGGVGAAAVSAIVFLPAGFFMTGTSARVAAGTQVHARIDEDVALNIPTNAAPANALVQATPPAGAAASASTTPSATPASVTLAAVKSK